MKLPHRRQFLHLTAAAAALPAVSRITWAQTYPTRPVRLIVGWPPGGAVPPGAYFHGVDRHHRGLVDTDVGELDRPRCRWWPCSSRVAT
jgi:hypothetical protein